MAFLMIASGINLQTALVPFSSKIKSSEDQAPSFRVHHLIHINTPHTTTTMAKDKTEAEIAAKKEKKDKKRKLEEVEDVEAVTPKKEKKKKRKSEAAAENDESVMDVDGQSLVKIEEADEKKDEKAVVAVPLAALVPFANPLADEKAQKKVLKTVKKGKAHSSFNARYGCQSHILTLNRAAAKSKSLKRGVKECVKSIRKSPPATPASLSPNTLPPGIVILAADISPMDVISHIPVLCEDHNIPYIYVPSRAELGAAGSTKRPTSVVMLTPNVGGKKDEKKEGSEEWLEAYKDLHKLALKLGQTVKV